MIISKKEFIIATDVKNTNPLEMDLHNLKVRLKIHMDIVERIKADIRIVEEMLEEQQKE